MRGDVAADLAVLSHAPVQLAPRLLQLPATAATAAADASDSKWKGAHAPTASVRAGGRAETRGPRAGAGPHVLLRPPAHSRRPTPARPSHTVMHVWIPIRRRAGLGRAGMGWAGMGRVPYEALLVAVLGLQRLLPPHRRLRLRLGPRLPARARWGGLQKAKASRGR
jgi:hypothetical protein